MSKLIVIENTEMQIREYVGQRVVIFDDICTVHNCERKRLTKHFERKRKHFIKDEDYFEITRKELSDITSPNSKIIGNPNIKTYLFTESGYLMIVKCLDDDIAWNVQRQLVNSYFRIREEKQENPLAAYAVPVKPLDPEILHKVSSRPAPKATTFYARNRWKIKRICDKMDCPKSSLYHWLLSKLSEEYDIDEAKRIYEKENGYPPEYPMDIVDYFPEMEEKAEEMITKVFKYFLEKSKSNN